MTETNLSISRVENGFVIEDYRPADRSFKGTVSVAETSTGLAALVAAWGEQFEPSAPVVTKIDIRGAEPVEAPFKPGARVFWTDGDSRHDEVVARCVTPCPNGRRGWGVLFAGDHRGWMPADDCTLATPEAKSAEAGSPAPSAEASSPLVVREHGIYEQRDGTIVGPIIYRSGTSISHAPWAVGGGIWFSDGVRLRDGASPEDLVREIVVGEGWKPWNGGECPVEPRQMVKIITRGGGHATMLAGGCSWRCSSPRHVSDIVAYRLSTEG